MNEGLENIYSEQSSMGRRLGYLETIEDGTSTHAGFKRVVSRPVSIATDANVVVSRFTAIEAGGALTIKSGGELTVIL